MKRFAIALLVAPILLVTAFGLLQPRAARSYVAGELWGEGDFDRVEERVLASRELGPAERAELLETLGEARKRVATLFRGEPVAQPKILVADDPERLDLYMENLHGATHTTPLGAVIVLGPSGRGSVDVVAHELVHAEHFARAGFWKYVIDTPMWFVEGLGMQVDHRERYAEAAWQEITEEGKTAPDLEDLVAGSGFGSGDVTANYATAKRAVARWRAAHSRAALGELIESWGFQRRWEAHSD